MIPGLGRRVAQRLRRDSVSPAAAFAIALAISMAVIGVRYAIEMIVSGVVVFGLIFPAVAVGSLIAGWRAGLWVIFFCQIAVWYLFLPVLNSFTFETPGNAVSLGLTTFLMLFIVWAVTVHQRLSDEMTALERTRAEDLELAMRELDHRTMNNFQMAAALLRVEASGNPNAEVRSSLEAASARINILGQVHKELKAHPTSMTERHVKPLLTELLESLRALLPAKGIAIVDDLEDVILTHDGALRVTLVVNELVTNAIKHAFPQNAGLITVRLWTADGTLFLAVKDNGVGKTEVGPAGSGGKLVGAFVKSMRGSIETANDNGASFEVRIPLEHVQP